MRWLLALAALVATPVPAQVIYPPVGGGVTQAQLDAVAAAMPQPDGSVPPMETVAGAAGSQATYRRGDAVQPRITRAGQCTISGGAGACSGTWSTSFPVGQNINVLFTPVNTVGSQPIICNLTATPSITAYAAKCWTIQNSTLAAVTVLTVSVAVGSQNVIPAVAAADGTVIQVTGLPKTQ